MNNLILGIHCGHDATAALIDEKGNVIAAVAEERITRVKYHAGFPYQAIDEVLRLGNVTKKDIKHISSSTKRLFFPTDTWYNNYLLSADLDYKNKYDISNMVGKTSVFKDVSHIIKSKIFKKEYAPSNDEIEAFSRKLVEDKLKEVGFQNFKLDVIEHHQTHAASAYFQSGKDQALVVTMDGAGDGLCATVSTAKGLTMERHAEVSSNCSLGRVYSEITRFMGFKRNRHEGKITGLAAYGDALKYYKDLSKFIRFDKEKEQFTWDVPNESAFQRKFKTLQRILAGKNLGLPQIDAMQDYLAKHFNKEKHGMDLSAAVQKISEDIAVDFVQHFLKKYPNKNVVLAGGIFANVRVNQVIAEIPDVEYVYIHQNMGDGGCALGAALQSWADQVGQEIPALPKDVYFGAAYSDNEILEALQKFEKDLSWETSVHIEKDIAEMIHNDVIVGRFYGRMEYGPRSLGNRSILAKTTDRTINDWLNKRLNRTEFMPFAPIIYDKMADDVLIGYDKSTTKYASEFMTVTYAVAEKWVDVLQAAVHVDGTARPQVVTKNNNPELHEIAERYFELSGIPGFINTSFNAHEEPIVMTPEHAIRSLIFGTIDVLAIGSFKVKKR
jgi:carbamoyltransferase